MLSLIQNDNFQSLLIATCSAVLIASTAKLFSFIRFKIDEKKIVEFIKTSKSTFRSTEAICSNTGIPPEQITVIASRSKKLRRNSKKKELWCLK